MATSIGKLSKSFFIKLLVGIIILPFVFWGMGDVFRGGNQNVIATIDSKKISTQEFMNYFLKITSFQEQNMKNFFSRAVSLPLHLSKILLNRSLEDNS